MAVEQRIETGVTRRHIKACAFEEGGAKCNKACSYQTFVFDKITKRRQKFSDPELATVRRWRQDRMSAMRGGARVLEAVTIGELYAEFWEGVERGTVLNRAGRPYRPSTLVGLRGHWHLHLLPRFDKHKLGELTTADVQWFIDSAMGTGMASGTIHNIVMSLRTVLKWAKQRGKVNTNACDGVSFPAKDSDKRGIVAWPQAQRMLQALLDADRPAWEVGFWAIGFLAGLRRGELLALTWDRVDMDKRQITVAASYDRARQSMNLPKTKHSIRTVPFPEQLVPYLELLAMAREDRTGLVLSRDGVEHPSIEPMIQRCRKVWAALGLPHLTPHEARHTYASLMLAAGVDIYLVSKYMGHSSIQITVDTYGHLVEGVGDDTRAKFSDYLSAQTV